MSHFKFLFLHSDPQINFLTKQILELENLPISAHFERNPLKALQYLDTQKHIQFPDVIIVNHTLSLMTSSEFVDRYNQQFQAFHPDAQLYLTANYCDAKLLSAIAQQEVIQGFLPQPFSRKIFLDKIVPNLQALKFF